MEMDGYRGELICCGKFFPYADTEIVLRISLNGQACTGEGKPIGTNHFQYIGQADGVEDGGELVKAIGPFAVDRQSEVDFCIRKNYQCK